MKQETAKKIDKSSRVLCDQIGKLKGFYISKIYPDTLRGVKYHDEQSNRTFICLTHSLDITSVLVALRY